MVLDDANKPVTDGLGLAGPFDHLKTVQNPFLPAIEAQIESTAESHSKECLKKEVNRLSAKRSRDRKNQRINDLETQVHSHEALIRDLSDELEASRREKKALESELRQLHTTVRSSLAPLSMLRSIADKLSLGAVVDE